MMTWVGIVPNYRRWRLGRWYLISDERGIFTVSIPLPSRWRFSTNVLRRSNGEIWWFTLKPLGVLIKYPCGTKRFIKGVTELPE